MFYRHVPCVVLYQTWILSKWLNLIGFHSNRKDKFSKEKNLLLWSRMGMKLKLCRNVHNISLCRNYVTCFRCYSNLKFTLTYNGKSEGRHLLLSYCRYFDKSFTEMFLDYSSIKYMNFVQTAVFDWFLWQPKGEIFEKILKNLLLWSCMGDEAETLQKCSQH